ncbi:MAG: hypothetical protein WAN43_18050 [Rhodomicrobium sp.]
MSDRNLRRKRKRLAPIHSHVGNAFAGVIRSPLRAAFIGALSLVALWLVLARSLPYALAPVAPDLALALNPNNPAALLAKAEAAKKKLLDILGAAEEAPKTGEAVSPSDGTADTLSRLPEVKGAAAEPVGEREKLRAQIRALALRAIANDPLNARAFRLLAEATASADQVRVLMQEALKRSRRESIAAFWLLNDSYYRNDFKAAIYYSDILLRTQPALATHVLGYLCLLADNPEARPLLIAMLEFGPAWRRRFFDLLPDKAKNPDTPLAFITTLRNSKKPIADNELQPYLNHLIRNDHVDLAYNAWLQFLPPSRLENLGLLTNANFQTKPNGLPFDWQFGEGVNALAEIVPLNNGGVERVLHISFGEGRIKFPEVRQVLYLAPGRYRLEGKLHGAISGKRGLRWQLRCLDRRAQKVLGETEMLLGRTEQWRVFSFEAEAPAPKECLGQELRLIHDARSASEELITGEVWFNDLRLERIPAEDAQWRPQP